MRAAYLNQRTTAAAPTGTAKDQPGMLIKVWKLGWGLLFIIVMTILSECGPHTIYTKMHDAAAATATPPSAGWVK